MEDILILRLFWKRSQEALVQVQEKYGRQIHSLSSSILQDARDAEEAVSDTYLRLWNSIPPAQPDNLLAFALKLSRNAALDILKTKRRKKRDDRVEILFSELDSCLRDPGSITDHLEYQELAGLINRYLRTLDATSRNLFIRRYFAMEELDSLSAHFGMTKHTLSSRLYRMRKGLRAFLEKEGIPL